MMLSFNDSLQKYILKSHATSNLEIQQIFTKLSSRDIRIFSGDISVSTNLGIVNLHPTKGTHWVASINEVILIVVPVELQTNYLVLLKNEMGIVYNPNTKKKVRQKRFFLFGLLFI